MAQLRAVDYLRVSTDEQAKGYGIAYTGKKTRRLIDKKGWEHVRTFADEGQSGSLDHTQRPDLKRLMALAHETPRPFDVVVVSEERAIGRRDRAFWPWVWQLEDLGIFVAIVKGDYDNTTAEGRSRMRKAADRAEDERETIRDRTQGGIQEKAEDGGHPGGKARYGYRIENQGRKGLSRLVLDVCDGQEACTRSDMCETVHENAVLRRGRVLAIKHCGNWEKVVLALNAEGMVTRSGKPWTAPNFRSRILDEDLLEGRYVFRNTKNAVLKDGEPVWGESITISLDRTFTPEEVAELKRAIKGRSRRRATTGRLYTLSGRIKSLCGRHYVGGSPTAKSVSPHYVCAGKTPEPGKPRCSCSQLDAESIEKEAWHRVARTLGDAEYLEQLAEKHMKDAFGQRTDFASRLAELDQLVAEQADAIDLATVMAAKQAAKRGLRGADAEASIERLTKPLQAELEQLEEQRQEVAAWQREAEQAQGRINDLRALAEASHDALVGLSGERQRNLLALLDIQVVLTAEPPQMRKGAACTLADWFREQDRLVPDLTDETWSRVADLFGDHRQLDARKILEALLRKAASGARWSELEREYGTKQLRIYWHRWKASGLWEKALLALPKEGQPVPRRHPMPQFEVRGLLQPGLILASVSESHEAASGPWAQFSNLAYRFQLASAS